MSDLRSRAEPRASTRLRDRIVWTCLALSSAAVLLTARALTPAAAGIGTHTQLGLPPCGFLLLFQLPCPACGLTTAFAHLAHLSVHASLEAQPLGLPLFLLVIALLVRASAGALRAHSLRGWLGQPSFARGAIVLSAALLLVWAVKLSAP